MFKTKLDRLVRDLQKLESDAEAEAVRGLLADAREKIDAAIERLKQPGYPASSKAGPSAAMVRPPVFGGI
ncbi:MAG: hypothetical protein IID41_05135 [Planctomycetes bacterium]|nr:hypothetical protein [Planctomycetota bacterium]